MSLNLAVTAGYVINFVWRHSTYTNGHPVAAGQLLLSSLSLAALAVSGYLGGKLAYRFGVRVASETTQAEGFGSLSTRPGADRAPAASSAQHRSPRGGPS